MLEDEELRQNPYICGNVEIHIRGIPSMTDHKTKKLWTEEMEGRDMSDRMAYTACYGCGASYKELKFRHHEKFKNLSPEAKKLCFANCHVKTCTFNWLIKGCCYRDFKKYAVQTDADKVSREQNKLKMIDDFWNELELKVCQVTPGKTGTTNTGPVVKESFRHIEKLSEIVHCPENLLYGLKTIFDALDCCLLLDAKKFKQFTSDWLDEFDGSSVSWNQLSPTLHFILHHGYEVNCQLVIQILKIERFEK